MLEAAPAGLLRVNRGPDTTRLNNLLTFMTNAILKSGNRLWKPTKFNIPGWNERAKELDARCREVVSHWNIARLPGSGSLAELKYRA